VDRLRETERVCQASEESPSRAFKRPPAGAALRADPKSRATLPRVFHGQINNAHTRRAYLNATRLADWCASKDLHEIAFLLRFRIRGRTRGFLKRLSIAKKAGCQDSGSLKSVDPGPSWSVGFTLLPVIFPNLSFSPGRLALGSSEPARPLSFESTPGTIKFRETNNLQTHLVINPNRQSCN
jgi:hypothetical protein